MHKDKLSVNLKKSDFPDEFPQLWIKLGNDYGTIAVTFGDKDIGLTAWLKGNKRKVTKKTYRY